MEPPIQEPAPSPQVLARRQSLSWLAKQPTRRRFGSARFARWSWLEPSSGRKVQPGDDADRPLRATGQALPERAPTEKVVDDQPHTSWTKRLETIHEERERHRACQSIAKVLAAQFGCENQPERLEDVLASKEAEIGRLKEEVLALTAEKEAAESALEAAEAKLAEAAKAARGGGAAEAEAAPPLSAQEAKPGQDVVVRTARVDSPAAADISTGLPALQGSGPEEEVAAIRREREEGIRSESLREMFLGCVELLAADIYASRAHFVLELLQNADDNEYTEGVEPEARFLLHHEAGSQAYIAVVNNEIGLTAQDLVGMCAISKSAKKEKADRTGRKGIGFKSVFAVSSCPHVLSRSYTFKFDVRNDRMGYIMPTWIDAEELRRSVPDEIQRLHKEGFTVIYLPVSEPPEALLTEVEGHLEALDPATLLFMRRLRRIEFRGVGGGRTSFRVQARGSDGLQREVVSAEECKGDDLAMRTFEFYVGRRMTQGVFGDACTKRPLAVALPVPDSAGAPQRAFATLPLCHTGLGVCINADWDVSASRDGVHENAHNEQLALETAKVFAEVAQELGSKLLPVSPVDYLGDRAPLSRFWRRVRERFISELLRADVPCLLVEDGSGTGTHYVPASSALRRPSATAPLAEQAAAGLISSEMLMASVGRCFVREPLPQGLQVESFTATHFARCLPKLTEAALAEASFAERTFGLAKLYTALEGLLSETGLTRPELHKIQDRADLAHASACWPCKSSKGAAPGETLICAAGYGPIFADMEASLDASLLLPAGDAEARHRWRLRLLLPEAAEALKATSRLRDICHVRPQVTPWHLVGLAMELHGLQSAEDRADVPDTAWWLSLRVVRDAWQSQEPVKPAEAEEDEEADPLVSQGRALMDAERMKAILFVPSASGLLHVPAVSCQLIIGQEVATAPGGKPPVRLPSAHPAEALREALCWERFLHWLGAEEPALAKQEAARVAAKILDPDWWLLVEASASRHLPWLLSRLQGLPALPFDEDGCWDLAKCLSADFAPYLLGVQLRTRKQPPAAAPPLCAAKGGEFAPEARRCLSTLGVTLDVNMRSLLERCLDPMLEAAEQTLPVPLANFRRVYAAFHARSDGQQEWRASLRSRIHVPHVGKQDADNCVYLPPNLEGMSELLGRVNLQPLYPDLRDFFVGSLGVSDSLSAKDCLAAVRTLQQRDAGATRPSPMAAGLFTALMDMALSNQSLRGEIQQGMLIPVPSQDGSGLRWLPPQRCMWLDVPSGLEMGFASLEAYYAPELRPFFLDVLGIPLLSSVEVQTRLRTAASAASADATSVLHRAYQDLEKLCKSIDEEGSEDIALKFLKKDLSDMVFLPASEEQPSKDAFVFLSAGHPDLAAHSGKIDLSLHFPDLGAYFTATVGLASFLDVDACLRALRRLQAADEDAQGLALAIYSNLQQAHGCSMQASDFGLIFEEEPLVFAPAAPRSAREVARSLKSGSSPWRRSVDCMWHDVPSGVELGCRSLEGRLPSNLEDFCVELLGVPALSAAEVAARLDLVRRTTSQADVRSNGPSCERHVVTAYLEILAALQHRLAAGVQFRNPQLLEHLRDRVFIPDVGYVNAKKCRWRSSSSLRGRSGFHELYEVYGEDGRWSAETQRLHRYFVFWLGVPTSLTLEESLDLLRELKSSSRFSQLQDAPEGSVLSRAAAIYREVGSAFRFPRTAQKEADDALEELRTQGLIYVPGAEPPWRKADQCLWEKPSKCPEGWVTQREELAAPYSQDALLKELFTERLGIPVSVRFEGTQHAETVPLQGQPCWLLEATEAPLCEAADEPAPVEPSSGSVLVHSEEAITTPAQTQAADATPQEDGQELEPPTVAQQRPEPPSKQELLEKMEASADDVPPPPEPYESSVQIRGAASDGRRQRRRMLEKLASSVLTIQDNRQMKSRPNQVKHRSEACLDCNPQHDLYKVGVLTSQWNKDVSIPVWVERNGQEQAMKRLKAAIASQSLDRFADLLAAISNLFSVPCQERVHIFEEDTQTVAFNGGALFFNLRYFIEESHASNWEEAVSFWAVSFAHELAHFESPLHDRQHGRAMEMSQRAVLPGLARVLAQPWGAAVGARDVVHRKWTLQGAGGALMS